MICAEGLHFRAFHYTSVCMYIHVHVRTCTYMYVQCVHVLTDIHVCYWLLDHVHHTHTHTHTYWGRQDTHTHTHWGRRGGGQIHRGRETRWSKRSFAVTKCTWLQWHTPSILSPWRHSYIVVYTVHVVCWQLLTHLKYLHVRMYYIYRLDTCIYIYIVYCICMHNTSMYTHTHTAVCRITKQCRQRREIMWYERKMLKRSCDRTEKSRDRTERSCDRQRDHVTEQRDQTKSKTLWGWVAYV